MLFFVYHPRLVAIVVGHDAAAGEFVCQLPYFPPHQAPDDFSEVRTVCIKIENQTSPPTDLKKRHYHNPTAEKTTTIRPGLWWCAGLWWCLFSRRIVVVSLQTDGDLNIGDLYICWDIYIYIYIYIYI